MTMKELRDVYPGIMMANVGYDPESAEKEIADGYTDLVSFGRPYIVNPDLVERLTLGAKLEEKQDHTIYFSSYGNRLGPKGYTDYPTLEKTET